MTASSTIESDYTNIPPRRIDRFATSTRTSGNVQTTTETPNPAGETENSFVPTFNGDNDDRSETMNELTEAIERPADVATFEHRVLEYFSGRLESIDGNTAIVSLRSVSGEIFEGEYPVSRLLELGIQDGDPFDCETVETPNGVEVRISPRRRLPLTVEMLSRMSAELDESLSGLEQAFGQAR